MPRKSRPPRDATTEVPNRKPLGLRIIGGRHRGRRLLYSGDERTRPMKDRVRQAVFDLVGPDVVGKHAIDLFAGTGALGLEAISRGARGATLVERHNPTAQLIRENVALLELDSADVVSGNAFIWGRKGNVPGDVPWVVFVSPPYDLYVDRLDDMLGLIQRMTVAAPAGSVLVVEADRRFDFNQLDDPAAWDIREKPPAYLGIYRKAAASPGSEPAAGGC